MHPERSEVKLTMQQLQNLVDKYSALETRMARLEGGTRVYAWLTAALLTSQLAFVGLAAALWLTK
jgi:hypothetical protein